jgi:predicted GIY-YIG superfamily endonuclease
MSQIYILKLQHGKYYVGKSADAVKRYQEHLNGTGSSWTRLHIPVSLLETRPERSPLDEDTVTKECMFKYGIDNVRGGSYVTTELSAAQHTALQTEFRSARGLCTRCGRSGHFVKDCYAHVEEEESEEESEEEESEEEGCFRCGRDSHFVKDCYARTDKYGNRI